MSYEVRPAPVDDIDSGSVWITLAAGVPLRSVISISNNDAGADRGKLIYCEALAIDRNFVRQYNQRVGELIDRKAFKPLKLDPPDSQWGQQDRLLPDSNGRSLIFMSEYYRSLLGTSLDDFADHDLDVRVANGWIARCQACLQHPQIAIRLATVLGLLGFGLGILGAVFGVFGIVLAVIGIVLSVIGIQVGMHK